MPALSPASRAALARLRAFRTPATRYNDLPLTRRAAVLVLLFADRRGDLRVVLTIRSATMRNYAGQAALPGGKADSLTETPFVTARREAFEEIGLPTTDDELPPGYRVEHLVELPCNLAVTELGVRPCVAYLHATSSPETHSAGALKDADVARDLLPRLHAKEVAALFTASFRNFLQAEDSDARDRDEVPGRWYDGGSWHSWHEEAWRMHQFYVPVTRGRSHRGHGTDTVERHGQSLQDDQLQDETVPLHLRPGPGSSSSSSNHESAFSDPLTQPRYRVFGLTARILVDCARVAYGKAPTFQHNSSFGDEDMIAKLMKLGRLGPVREKGDVLTRDVMKAASKL